MTCTLGSLSVLGEHLSSDFSVLIFASTQVTMNKIKNMCRMRGRRRKRKSNMTTKLARMTEVLSRSPSTRNIGTTTKLSQNVTAGVTKPAVPSGRRRRRGKGSKRRGSRRQNSGSRKTKGVKGSRAVTSKKRTPGSRILHSKTRGVKFDGTRRLSII